MISKDIEKRKGGIRLDHGLDIVIIDKTPNLANGVVQDININGAKAVCNAPFQAGNEVVLEIKLFSSLGALRAKAQVIRVEPIFFEHGIKYSVAFKFTKLTPEAKEKIKSQLTASIDVINKSLDK